MDEPESRFEDQFATSFCPGCGEENGPIEYRKDKLIFTCRYCGWWWED
jgi:ribosomal protein L37AE/L43A